jgi:hypothetical protein
MRLFSTLFEIKVGAILLVALAMALVGFLLLIDGMVNLSHNLSKEGTKQNQKAAETVRDWRMK